MSVQCIAYSSAGKAEAQAGSSSRSRRSKKAAPPFGVLPIGSNGQIIALCRELCGPVALDDGERALMDGVEPVAPSLVEAAAIAILRGDDPLGDAFMAVNTADERRAAGQVYTPPAIVREMTAYGLSQPAPARVVDPGCGSGRFALQAARVFPSARVVAVDSSPLATLMCKAAVHTLGLDDRVAVTLGDFTRVPFQREEGPTFWLGNPPYVRHHALSADTKAWLAEASASLGISASGLSGLHAYFYLRIAQEYGPGDYGSLITSSEWLDTNYGQLVRRLLTERLGLEGLSLYDRSEQAFPGTNATAVVSRFSARSAGGEVQLRTARPWAEPAGSAAPQTLRAVSAERLRTEARWSPLFSAGSSAAETADAEGGSPLVPLSSYCRVHRGIVTGDNKFWVTRDPEGIPPSLLVRVVSHAREIMSCGDELANDDGLSYLIALPPDLDLLDVGTRDYARSVIARGVESSVDKGYIARTRRPWWSVKLCQPAPILLTYMARRPPVFVRNACGALMLNVVHGIYPKQPLSDKALARLVAYLNRHTSQRSGRTYAGGLVKYEPREVEGLLVPAPEALER